MCKVVECLTIDDLKDKFHDSDNGPKNSKLTWDELKSGIDANMKYEGFLNVEIVNYLSIVKNWYNGLTEEGAKPMDMYTFVNELYKVGEVSEQPICVIEANECPNSKEV